MDASWKVLPQKVKKGEEKRGIKEEQKMKIKERESGRESLSSQALPAASEAFPAACEALPAFTNLYKAPGEKTASTGVHQGKSIADHYWPSFRKTFSLNAFRG